MCGCTADYLCSMHWTPYGNRPLIDEIKAVWAEATGDDTGFDRAITQVRADAIRKAATLLSSDGLSRAIVLELADLLDPQPRN